MSIAPDLTTPTTAVSAILVAVRALDPAAILAVLDEAADHHGLDVAVDDVVFPALRVVGSHWFTGALDVAHEHLLSSTVTRWVYGRLDQQEVHRRGRIVLAAGPHDQHVLGLDCLELLLAHRGVEVLNLGAQIPIESLVLAATQADAVAVVVCAHNSTATTQAVRAVKAAAAAGFGVYYAGSSFESRFVRQHTPGQPLDGPLSVTASLLAGLHTLPGNRAVIRPRRSEARLTA
jgi:methanogenic corrinoid protein MtbC1